MRNTYVDYLLSTEGHISATDLSEVVEGKYSHDQITRLLVSGEVNDKTTYLKGKNYIKQKGIKGTVTLSIDDSLVPKPHMQFSNIVNWHYDDAKRRCVKGIYFISALWSNDQVNVPLSLQVVEKELRWNENKQQYRWKCLKNKNDLMRQMVQRLTRSKQVDYVLADSWYSSKKNMNYIVEECETDFIMSVRCNRAVTRNEKDAQSGKFRPLRELKLGKGAVKLYLKGVHFPVLVAKQVYKNADGSSSTLYLATSDLELRAEQIVQLYKRRWKVEEYHKSMKSNCSLGKCQAPSLTSQQSHFYLAALAFLLLEKTKVKEDHNHFALKKQLNLLTIKYGMKVIKQYLHSKSKFVYNAA
jgi:hypothetical protein